MNPEKGSPTSIENKEVGKFSLKDIAAEFELMADKMAELSKNEQKNEASPKKAEKTEETTAETKLQPAEMTLGDIGNEFYRLAKEMQGLEKKEKAEKQKPILAHNLNYVADSGYNVLVRNDTGHTREQKMAMVNHAKKYEGLDSTFFDKNKQLTNNNINRAKRNIHR